MGTPLPLPAVGFAICCVRSGICSLQGCHTGDDTSLLSIAGLSWLGCTLPMPGEPRVPQGWAAAGWVWALRVALLFVMVLSHSLESQELVPETVAQDAQVPVALARALGHRLGAECGRQGPASALL